MRIVIAVSTHRLRVAITTLLASAVTATITVAQNPPQPATNFAPRAPLLPLPAPLGMPKPGPTNDAPYAPQPILPGGVVIALFPPGSPYLKMERVREAEQYSLSRAVPGRIGSIVNIHNPSIEVHTVDGSLNTGAAIMLLPQAA